MTRRLPFLLVVWLIAGCKGTQQPARIPPGVVVARAVTGELPRTAPTARAWNQAGELVVALLPQDLVEPKLAAPGVAQVKVRALHDRGWIAFRLEWADARRDTLVGPGQFSDAAAVQLPTEAAADVTDPAMGLAGRPVAISYWKAAWQETGDPVARLRPNMAPTFYPPQAAAGANRAALEMLYAPARGAHNPVTVRERGAAVQDLRSEGAGTLTAPRQQVSVGAGVWKNGAWQVIIARPLATADGSPFRPGRRTYIAFAIWDGAAGHVGAKKMRSGWIPLTLEGNR
jgi:DMSO reductase family type II enzyme heme b subunit